MIRKFFIIIVIVLYFQVIGYVCASYVWSPWTPCSVSCGKGLKFRRKICEKKTNPSCSKNSWEVKQCTKVCKYRQHITILSGESIDDGNSYLYKKRAFLKSLLKPKWSKWSSCTEKCGNGIQIRHRSCRVSSDIVKGVCKFNRIDLRLCVGQNKKCTKVLHEISENREHSDPEVLSRQKTHLYIEYVMLIMMAGVCIGLLFILQLMCRQTQTQNKPN